MAAPIFIGGAILVLAPVIWLGFRVLASYSAWPLTGLFFATNGLLLIPLREESWVAWILLGASVLVFWQTARIGRRDSTVKTMEGVLARGLQFLPLAILFGRTVDFLFTAMSAAVFLLLRQIALELDTRSKLRVFSERLAILLEQLVRSLIERLADQMANSLIERILHDKEN